VWRNVIGLIGCRDGVGWVNAAHSLTSPTCNCALRLLLLLQGELGELVSGAAADLLVVDGDPLEDISVLANSSNIKLVIKNGLLAKVRGQT
jgi:imidazolonepropionase-like amidohydrolase